MTMQKKLKVAAGSAAALAILIAGGLAIALPAQAAPTSKSVSVVEPVDATDTDNVQDGVDEGTGTDAPDAAETTDGPDGADSTGVEDSSDDVNGVEVEDGTTD
ncbi:hypothetical protein [Salinibacterium sp.]|uniref:hypothetical protein n=1 Tax=Salinibacterium sp. TaxID=1915057 RepID=UPI00286ADD17|nr:hypothetical protein [Salinibacterium sp.]